MDRDDGTGTPADGPSTSGFQFNLDAALNELRRSRPPTLADLMRVGQDGADASETDASTAGAGDGVPVIREATTVDDPPRPAAGLATSWTPSNTGSDGSAAGSAGTNVAPPSTPAAASHTTPALPSYASAPSAASGNAATDVTSAVAVMDAPAMPSIPTIPKVPVPPPVAPVTATVAPPLPAITAASRARMKQRKRRTGAKAFLVLLVMGGVVAGALLYGRAYLFPDEWDRDLVPIADEIEATAGVEFADAVPLRQLPVDEYDVRASAALFGTEWEAQVPVWRALGLAAGDATPGTFGKVLHAWSPAVYDAAAGEVVAIDDLGGTARTAALTEQLAAVLVDQLYDANTVVDPANPLAARAIVSHQIDLTARASNTAQEQTIDRSELDALPSPLAHELLARADLGAAAAAAAGLELAPSNPSALEGVSEAAANLFGAQPEAGSPPQVVTGDVPGAETFTPTRDLLYLVFGAYLPADAAAAGADAVSRSSISVATRGATTCAYATFAGADAATTGVIQFVVNAWAQAAPGEANATPSTSDDGTVQLVTCDPGPAPSILPRPGVAAELVARQVALLAGAG